jgi:predicted nucleic acid-binding protein
VYLDALLGAQLRQHRGPRGGAEPDRGHQRVVPRAREQGQEQPILPQLLHDLDNGEAEAIVLAIDLKATYILMDEALGRKIALSYNLQPLGVLGMLVLAKQRGLIEVVTPLMDRLKSEANFYIDSNLYYYIKEIAQE